MDELDLTAAESKATYEEIKKYVLEHTGLKVSNAAGKQPYMSTQFGDLYRKWARVSKATMRISRKPGETFEVDWAGATVDIHDSVTGEITPAYLFVGVLSCSSLVCC